MNSASKQAKQTFTDEGSPSRYFAMMLHIDDDDLDPFEYKLLGHYKKLCGLYNTDVIFESNETSAGGSNMSVYAVRQARKGLVAKGCIKVQATNGRSIVVHLINRMKDNLERYSKPDPYRKQEGYQIRNGSRAVFDRADISNSSPDIISKESKNKKKDSLQNAGAFAVSSLYLINDTDKLICSKPIQGTIPLNPPENWKTIIGVELNDNPKYAGYEKIESLPAPSKSEDPIPPIPATPLSPPELRLLPPPRLTAPDEDTPIGHERLYRKAKLPMHEGGDGYRVESHLRKIGSKKARCGVSMMHGWIGKDDVLIRSGDQYESCAVCKDKIDNPPLHQPQPTDGLFDAIVEGLSGREVTKADRSAFGWRAGQILHGDKRNKESRCDGLLKYEEARQEKSKLELDYPLLAEDMALFWKNFKEYHSDLDLKDCGKFMEWWGKFRIAQDKANGGLQAADLDEQNRKLLESMGIGDDVSDDWSDDVDD